MDRAGYELCGTSVAIRVLTSRSIDLAIGLAGPDIPTPARTAVIDRNEPPIC